MMRNRNQMFGLTIYLFITLLFALAACSGGSGSGSTQTSATPRAALEVIPAEALDFGTVTNGNWSDLTPLKVTLKNSGTASLEVSEIRLSDSDNFTLDTINEAVNPCGSINPTIPIGDSCNVEIAFSPNELDKKYSASLIITSNGTNSPYLLSLSGTWEPVSTINVKISQIDACPREGSKAYVSVTDQGGFPVSGLGEAHFTISENGSSVQPQNVNFVDKAVSLSVALLMDYSGSITDNPTDVEDMESAAINFVKQLGDEDEAEIIKFATTYEVTQPFTSSETDLEAAILSEPDVGRSTLLYDTVVMAIENIKDRQKERRAIILFTDGVDFATATQPLSKNTLQDVIDDANLDGIPVFTVGLGEQIDPEILQQLSDDTGGNFYKASTSRNLVTIYQQLANLLFVDQYILTYNSSIAPVSSDGILEVSVKTDEGISGGDTKAVPACGP